MVECTNTHRHRWTIWGVRKKCSLKQQSLSLQTKCDEKKKQKTTESLEVRWPTSGSVHDSLDVKEERSEPHLHQELVAMVQADAKGKVALKHSLLWTLWRAEELCESIRPLLDHCEKVFFQHNKENMSNNISFLYFVMYWTKKAMRACESVCSHTFPTKGRKGWMKGLHFLSL